MATVWNRIKGLVPVRVHRFINSVDERYPTFIPVTFLSLCVISAIVWALTTQNP